MFLKKSENLAKLVISKIQKQLNEVIFEIQYLLGFYFWGTMNIISLSLSLPPSFFLYSFLLSPFPPLFSLEFLFAPNSFYLFISFTW